MPVEYEVMRLHRFYVNKPLGEEIVVEHAREEEQHSKLVHQWHNVFRYTSGDEVFLFSETNPGTDYRYSFSSLSKQGATLIPVSTSPNILPSVDLTLVMALVKKDTFETIVRQATELGVTRIIPVEAARSEKKNLNFERLSVISTEASEQCGRGDIPKIGDILTFDEALEKTKDSLTIMGSLKGKAISPALYADTRSKKVAVWVGPEGGWTEEEERAAFKHGIIPFLCAETVLKADTATTALIASVLTLATFPEQA